MHIQEAKSSDLTHTVTATLRINEFKLPSELSVQPPCRIHPLANEISHHPGYNHSSNPSSLQSTGASVVHALPQGHRSNELSYRFQAPPHPAEQLNVEHCHELQYRPAFEPNGVSPQLEPREQAPITRLEPISGCGSGRKKGS
jgi:hypothetical protein